MLHRRASSRRWQQQRARRASGHLDHERAQLNAWFDQPTFFHFSFFQVGVSALSDIFDSKLNPSCEQIVRHSVEPLTQLIKRRRMAGVLGTVCDALPMATLTCP